MVQFTIAYVALGFAVLLVLGGLLAISQRPVATLTPLQRIIVWGGLGGMGAFLVATAYWLRR
jgi:hypothetical protein